MANVKGRLLPDRHQRQPASAAQKSLSRSAASNLSSLRHHVKGTSCNPAVFVVLVVAVANTNIDAAWIGISFLHSFVCISIPVAAIVDAFCILYFVVCDSRYRKRTYTACLLVIVNNYHAAAAVAAVSANYSITAVATRDPSNIITDDHVHFSEAVDNTVPVR